jgi:hypothetical protein
MPASHAFYSKMLAERTASRNVFVLFLFYFILYSQKYNVLLVRGYIHVIFGFLVLMRISYISVLYMDVGFVV